MYEKKEENSQYNQSVVRVNSSYINFYDKQNIKDQPVYHTFSIKVDNDFDYMKTSEKYVNGSTLVSDISTVNYNDHECIREVSRKYDENGVLVSSFVKFDDFKKDKRSYIEGVLFNSNEVKRLFNHLEEILPGISIDLADINPLYNKLIDRFINKDKVLTKKKI